MNLIVKIIILILGICMLAGGIAFLVLHDRSSSRFYKQKSALGGGIALIVLGVVAIIIGILPMHNA